MRTEFGSGLAPGTRANGREVVVRSWGFFQGVHPPARELLGWTAWRASGNRHGVSTVSCPAQLGACLYTWLGDKEAREHQVADVRCRMAGDLLVRRPDQLDDAGPRHGGRAVHLVLGEHPESWIQFQVERDNVAALTAARTQHRMPHRGRRAQLKIAQHARTADL